MLANSLRDKPRQVRRTPLMRSTSPSDRTFPQNRISGSILWLMVSLLCFRNHTLSRAHMVVQLFFQNFPEQCLWEIGAKYPSRFILSGVHISVFVRTNAECTRQKLHKVSLTLSFARALYLNFEQSPQLFFILELDIFLCSGRCLGKITLVTPTYSFHSRYKLLHIWQI